MSFVRATSAWLFYRVSLLILHGGPCFCPLLKSVPYRCLLSGTCTGWRCPELPLETSMFVRDGARTKVC